MKSRAAPWTVEELSQLPLGSEKLRSRRGKTRSRQCIYKHLKAFEQKDQARKVAGLGWTWNWETETDLPKSQIRELPEINILRKACEKGDFLYSYNRRMFSEPEKHQLLVALEGAPPAGEKTKPKSDTQARQIGCMYVHTDIEDVTRAWRFVRNWRDRFLVQEAYFLPDILEWLLDNRGIIADLGIDIEFLTGKRSLRALPAAKIRELRNASLGSSKILQVVFSVDIDALFSWLESPTGKNLMARILRAPRFAKKAKQIASDWAIGDKLASRLRRE